MKRAVKISLKFATAKKLRQLEALRRELRGCRQAYVDLLWGHGGSLDAKTLNAVPWPSLSYRHRSNCLKLALECIAGTLASAKATGRVPSKPDCGHSVTLSSLVAKTEKGSGSFDYILKVSWLVPGEPLVIPFKSHKVLNYWLSFPGARIINGCVLGDGWATLWIDVPDGPAKTEGTILAIDLGINKLAVDSEGTQYGTEIKQHMARVRRCRPGSRGMLRARRARDQYIRRELKKLPWDRIRVIGHEDLAGIKQGKKRNRSKKFRKMIAPWVHRQAITRVEELAQANRVRPVSYNPKNTSRACPKCGLVAKENRRGETFDCVGCRFTADADHIGAINGLARTRGNCQEPMVPASPCG